MRPGADLPQELAGPVGGRTSQPVLGCALAERALQDSATCLCHKQAFTEASCFRVASSERTSHLKHDVKRYMATSLVI